MGRITVWIMLAACAALIVWDIVVATNKERGDTISEITLAASTHKPWSGVIFGIVVGILIGHLFWPQVINPNNDRNLPINSGKVEK